MDDLYERIEHYLDGTMDAAERSAFEADLAAEPALAAALDRQREARERLGRAWAGAEADAALRDTLRALGAQYFRPGETPPLRNSRTTLRVLIGWAVAASTALLVAAWLFLRPPANERLYARYREFPEASFTERGATPSPASLETAATAFNQKKYAEALPAFQAYRQTHPDNLEAQFFTGLCQLELGHFLEARSIFEQMRATPNAWGDEAAWYLALSYLRENNRAKCVEILRAIGQGSAHAEEAKALMRALE